MEDETFVDPAHLAENAKAMILLKDPSAYTVTPDGDMIFDAPNPKWLEWSEIPLIADPGNCGHVFSMCYTCADSWGIDHYLKLYQDDQLVYFSPDLPAGQD